MNLKRSCLYNCIIMEIFPLRLKTTKNLVCEKCFMLFLLFSFLLSVSDSFKKKPNSSIHTVIQSEFRLVVFNLLNSLSPFHTH